MAVVALAVIAVVGVLTAPPPGDAPLAQAQTQKLLSLPASEQTQYFREHPAAAVRVLSEDPGFVVKWWGDLPKADRTMIATLMPDVFGNLEGVDYASRDAANRAQLRIDLAHAEKRAKAAPANVQWAQQVAALRSIFATIHGKRSPHRYLIELTEDRPPLAAVAIGDLDTATQVTYVIPGMGTYTTDMQLWTQSAQNVWDTQGLFGAPKTRSVISWIGYVTPPPGVAAALGEYATQGAPDLVRAIKGLHAARHGKEPTVSIIAHSYGTTMSADALASHDLGIYAFVMLGSAGVEDRITNANRLHAQYVYAGEARQDPEARFGRVTRRDPRAPSFGAIVIAVDGDPSEGLRPVTGHDPILHSDWNDDPFSSAWKGKGSTAETIKAYSEHLQRFGYLDQLTESLFNASIATTPYAKAHVITER